MASAPFHPIALQSVLRVLHATATAADWARTRTRRAAELTKHLHAMTPGSQAYDDTKAEIDGLVGSNLLALKKDGGPVGILDWTGPGVWTDATVNYLEVKYGVKWTDLRELSAPMRVGEVLVLPVTGFSPGIGQFGAGDIHREYRSMA